MDIRQTNLCLTVLLMSFIFFTACRGSESGIPLFNSEKPSASKAPSPNESSGMDDRLALEQGLEKLTYRVGPINLPAHMDAGDMAEKPLSIKFQTTAPVWFLGFSARVIDGNGKKIPNELLNYALMINLHDASSLCSDSSTGTVFVAASGNVNEFELPKGYAYPILATDILEARSSFRNDSNDEYNEAFLELTILVKSMNDMAKMTTVKPMFFEQDTCKHSLSSIPPNRAESFLSTYTMEDNSQLIAAYGILGDYGTEVQLESNAGTSSTWDAFAQLDEDHHIVSIIPSDSNEQTPQIKKDEKIDLKFFYDNISERWLDSVPSGVMAFFTIE